MFDRSTANNFPIMIEYKKGACLSKKWRMELFKILDIERAINNALAWRPVKFTLSVNCEIVKQY